MAATRKIRGRTELSGLAGWLLTRLGRATKSASQLSLVERIPLGARQSLALVEADGQRLLVATSGEGAPAFYPLLRQPAQGRRGARRVSW